MADMLSPGTWLERLEKRLSERWTREMGIRDAYYEGDHNLAFATAKFREAFGSLFGALADNWMEIVVDSPVERLSVQGIRFGTEEADKDAWRIWQANNLDSAADQIHTEAVKLGESYWLVDPEQDYQGESRDDADPPRITAEHPSQVIVACAPGDRRRRLAALKKWRDEDSFAYATLYLPNEIHKFVSQRPVRSYGGGKINWQRRADDPGGVNRLGEVPVVPICNNPSMLRGGRSDLTTGALSIQNAVNKILCDMLIGSEYQAFPMRVMLGVDQVVDENGQPISAYKASQQRLWTFPSKDSKVAEFTAADLENFGKSMDRLVRHLTAQTKTPPHYVVGEIVNASGDALKAAETGLVAKARAKMKPFGEGHEDMLRLCFKAMGDTEKAKAIDAEMIWGDPESRSQAQLADALQKLSTIGVPQEVLWERYGFSPQEIDRMKAMQMTEDLLQEIPPSRQTLRISETVAPDGTLTPAAPVGG